MIWNRPIPKCTYCPMRGSRGVTGGPDHPPLNNQNHIGLLSNTGPDHLKNHKATEPAFNVWPSSARQRIAFSMAFRWRVENGLLIVVHVFGSSYQLKKQQQKHKKIRCHSWTPSDKTF